MDALSKQKKDEYATAFAILALYDGGAEITSEQIGNLLEATGNDEVEAFYPIIFANFLNDPEKIGQMIASPGVGGGGMLKLFIVAFGFFRKPLVLPNSFFCLLLYFHIKKICYQFLSTFIKG